jgi:hypothetical protein
LTKKSRQRGPDVWLFRWSEKGSQGKRVYRKRVIGTLEEYSDVDAARCAVTGLIAKVNSANPRKGQDSMTIAQKSPTTPKAAQVRIIQGPKIELAKEHLTIINWTTNNPGGSPVHYGTVHCGTDPNSMIETVKSPIRLNQDHSSTAFRGLVPIRFKSAEIVPPIREQNK